MESIKATQKVTVDSFIRDSEEIPRRNFSLYAYVILGMIFLACLFLKHTGDQQWYVPFIAIGVILFLFTSKWSRRRNYRQAFKRSFREEFFFVYWEFDQESFTCKSGPDVATRYQWDWPVKIMQKPHGLLIEARNRIYCWIPKDSFTSEQEFSRLVELMKSKVKDYQVLTTAKA